MGWPPTAASCCVPGLGGSGPGWWWSRCPATPELNPVGPLWASLKGTGLANLVGDTLEEIAAVERASADPGHPEPAVFVPAPLRTVPW